MQGTSFCNNTHPTPNLLYVAPMYYKERNFICHIQLLTLHALFSSSSDFCGDFEHQASIDINSVHTACGEVNMSIFLLHQSLFWIHVGRDRAVKRSPPVYKSVLANSTPTTDLSTPGCLVCVQTSRKGTFTLSEKRRRENVREYEEHIYTRPLKK